MIPVQVEFNHPSAGIKTLYISDEYLEFKGKGQHPSKLKRLFDSILKKNGFWRPIKEEWGIVGQSFGSAVWFSRQKMTKSEIKRNSND